MPRAVPVAVTTAAPLPRTGWTVAADTATSGFEAAKALDDNTATAWKSTDTAMPHTITIDTKNRVALSGLTYLPATGTNGRIGQYRVQVSDNGTTWSANIATGTFADTATAKTVTINTVITRYVRLTAVTEAGNRVKWATAAEINLLGGTDPALPRTGWTVAADSQETAGEDAKAANAIDGNTGTIWHTQWQGGEPALPHTFTIDMHSVNLVSGLSYLTRQDGSLNGDIGQYRIETSMDGTAWSPRVTTGAFTDVATAQTTTFGSELARYVRLTALTEAGRRGPWTSAAEINLLGRPDPRLTRTGWTATADSQETVGEDGRAANALDGDPDTLWHTVWSDANAPGLPHTYTIDMKSNQLVGGLSYLPRQDSSLNGLIGQYRIQTSTDNATWTDRVTAQSFATTSTAMQTVVFPSTTARYLRITVTSSSSGPWSTAAEFYVLGPSGSVVAGRGTWSAPVGFPLIPVAAAVLPNGKVLTWSASWNDDYVGGTGRTLTATYDPATGVVTQREVTETGHDMFCPGISVLPDGRIMVTGGNDAAVTSIYNPGTDAWTNGPDMTTPRGYQSSVTLGDGRVFTIGGSWSGGTGGYNANRKNGEVWSATAGWTSLPGADVVPMLTADPSGNGDYRKDNHAWLIAWSGNKVLQAGPSKQMNWYTISGQGSVAGAGTRGDDGDAMNGNAVMYDTGKILTVGGAPSYDDSNATANAYVLTINGTTVTTKKVGSMANTRAFQNSVVLPDGKVLVVGGENFAVPFSDNTAVMNAELWDPATETFTTMATQAVPRTYHSIALLLPDARVLSAGGGLCGATCDTNHFDGQIFTPPYLLTAEGTAATRPTITTAPTTAANGATINVKTGSAVTAFSIVRMGTATHSVDTDQRRLSLVPTAANGGYNLTIPADKGIAVPGYWMLFALDAKGVPSVAKIIKIG
ncbi:discoidin domain-containing protein [Paractinoplanes ferrugineus]|nr:discoidin domain-containing protein [Actinoplanes ferrugineus]